jgi:hypothetical protein
MWNRIYVLYAAIVLHLIMGTMLLIDPDAAIKCTRISLVNQFVGNVFCLSLIYIGVSVAASLHLFFTIKPYYRLLLFLPQQSLLLVAGVGEVNVIITSRYLDDVVLPRAFLIGEEALGILFVGIHTWALLERYAYPIFRRKKEGNDVHIR